jgi:hypothetical protein
MVMSRPIRVFVPRTDGTNRRRIFDGPFRRRKEHEEPAEGCYKRVMSSLPIHRDTMIYKKTAIRRVFGCDNIRVSIFGLLDKWNDIKAVCSWFWSRKIVTFIAFRSTTETDYMLSILHRLPNLKHIDATGTGITWNVLQYVLMECQNVEHVVLDRCVHLDIPSDISTTTLTDSLQIILDIPGRLPMVLSVKDSWRLTPFGALQPRTMLPLVLRAIHSENTVGLQKVREIYANDNDWSSLKSRTSTLFSNIVYPCIYQTTTGKWTRITSCSTLCMTETDTVLFISSTERMDGICSQ